MEPISISWVVVTICLGVAGFIGWIIRNRFDKIDDLEERLIKVETKLDVLGDINSTLHQLRTDIEIIKTKIASMKS